MHPERRSSSAHLLAATPAATAPDPAPPPTWSETSGVRALGAEERDAARERAFWAQLARDVTRTFAAMLGLMSAAALGLSGMHLASGGVVPPHARRVTDATLTALDAIGAGKLDAPALAAVQLGAAIVIALLVVPLRPRA